jgi:hypothetical protein
VQGRITNGNLFPQISAEIQGTIDRLVKKAFRDLRDAVGEISDLIVNDVEMALTSKFQSVDDTENQETLIEKEKNGLMAEVRVLKSMHDGLLASISEI